MSKHAAAALVLLIIGAATAHASPELTRKLEGYSPTPYKDAGGYSIGWGHYCGHKCPARITPDEAERLFYADYSDAAARAERFAGDRWQLMTDQERNVLTDISYNLGGRLWQFERMRAAVHAGDIDGQIREMRRSKWYTQTGRRPEILISILNAVERSRTQ